MNYMQGDIEQMNFPDKVQSFTKIYRYGRHTRVKSWLWAILVSSILILLLPWTQSIRARGMVTTLRQEQRPQQVNSIISGAVSRWFVREGDFVKKGDTLLELSEVKVDYFDPRLLERTRRQIEAKEQSVRGYKNKADAGNVQTVALREALQLKLLSLDNKLTQQQLKVESDQAGLEAANSELAAYKRQLEAAQIMLDSGALALIDFERRKVNYQNALAKVNSAQNQLLQSRQELNILQIEQRAVRQEYSDKIAKAEGERFSSLSSAASTEAEIAKLQNEYANYDARSKFYFITAAQSGQITKAKKAGIGEFIKEGEMIVEIVPDNIQYAVEMFVDPMDLPLVHPGQKVRFVFDGFPAIVFSGWPGGSYGTFGGQVLAVEQSISTNGKFRALVVEDPQDRKWPSQLKIGGGAEGIALLKDVRIFYELWRHINGFPPEYYSQPTHQHKKTIE